MHEAEQLADKWEHVLRLAQRLLDLDKDTREIVLQRLSCTGTIKDMADAMGISNQAAHARMKAAMRKHAWVAELITIKERKEAHD
jgi:DNA-directed RNA polymerase specialized sigma24 family protein